MERNILINTIGCADSFDFKQILGTFWHINERSCGQWEAMKYTAVIAAVLLWSAGEAWCSSKQQEQASDLFSEQAARLIESLKMPEEQLAAVPKVLQDLELVLGTHWPGCHVKPFGSTVTGLAMLDSDIDAYALLPDRSIKAHGPINFKAVRVLKSSPNYANIVPKLFYVTFKYLPMQIKIDLLFNNIEGGRNSELLRYFLRLDERAHNLAIIVKHWWAKTQKLSGIKMVPSYGMACMVVFYLQQVGILPPISLLQENATPFIFEGWNSGYNEIDYKGSNNETLYHLLGGFFEFYNDFQYDKYVISTFLGRPLERSMFKHLKSVPAEFEYYRRNVCGSGEEPLNLRDEVVVQDLFLHNKNLAERIISREGSPFTKEFRRIALRYRENNESTFLDDILSVLIT